jgi:L-aspartate oxidase
MGPYDYVIVGSGIAGLYTALLAREHGTVLVLTKGGIEECNTRYAQGGIAAAIGPDDSPELHYQDTENAGAGLGDSLSMRILTDEAADRIGDLIRFGVPFDTMYGEISLAKEGAHSVARVVHAGGDATGQHIELTLSDLARQSSVSIREHSLLAEILVEGGAVKGVSVFDSQTGSVEEVECRSLVLATGGAGRLFHLTTNPEVATGDGVALAHRAGVEVMDMEFFQFHPTALRLPGAPPFLISEAVRGEGAILRNEAGRAFMADYDPDAELAARDIVARAIVAEMNKTGSDHVYLDVGHLPAEQVTSRFPQIYRFCLSHDLDLTRTPIPVAPAAHYMMGGVRTNSWGETNVRGLYAAGETACTGVHGANRLASNSLLETMVFAKRLVQRTRFPDNAPVDEDEQRPEERRELPVREVDPSRYPDPSLGALQRLMWSDVGIERIGDGLTRAAHTLAAWERVLTAPTDRPAYDLRNAVLTARLIAEAALVREESRGAHYRSDFPESSDAWLKHQVYAGRR